MDNFIWMLDCSIKLKVSVSLLTRKHYQLCFKNLHFETLWMFRTPLVTIIKVSLFIQNGRNQNISRQICETISCNTMHSRHAKLKSMIWGHDYKDHHPVLKLTFVSSFVSPVPLLLFSPTLPASQTLTGSHNFSYKFSHFYYLNLLSLASRLSRLLRSKSDSSTSPSSWLLQTTQKTCSGQTHVMQGITLAKSKGENKFRRNMWK